MRQFPHLFGDIIYPMYPHETHGEIAQGGHDLRPFACPNPTTILVIGRIAHVMRFVLNRPVTAMKIKKPLGVGLTGRHARDAVNNLLGGCLSFEIGHRLDNSKNLLHMREAEIIIERRARLNPPDFQPSVFFINRFVCREKNRSLPRAQCP